MYLRGRLTVNLTGTTLKLNPPRNFFGGVANLLTKGSWQTQEELETYKLLAFTQCANRALMEIGVKDVVRVSIGGEVIYEDLQNTPDDFPAAMQALQERLAQGYEPDPHSEFDLVLKHDDGALNSVVDLDFVREHQVGVDPVTMTVTAVPSEWRRGEDEDDDSYERRVGMHFQDQESFDEALASWEVRLKAFLNQIADHFRTNIGIEQIHIETRNVLPRRRDADSLNTYTLWGYPLYGYDLTYDLAYWMLWDVLWEQHRISMRNVYYGDYDQSYVYVGDSGWKLEDANYYDTTHPTPVLVDSGGGDMGSSSEWSSTPDWGSISDSGGGDVGSSDTGDSGGGGWLSSIGDFFSDSGGGGDVSDSSSSDSGGGGDTGGSSCGSCSGGGCSSGGGE